MNLGWVKNTRLQSNDFAKFHTSDPYEDGSTDIKNYGYTKYSAIDGAMGVDVCLSTFTLLPSPRSGISLHEAMVTCFRQTHCDHEIPFTS